jgi:hypothetical protein
MKFFLVAALAFCIGRWTRRRSTDAGREEKARLAVLALTVFAATVANAAVCGVLSGPYDRYQARVIWLFPFLAALFELKGHPQLFSLPFRERSRAPAHESLPEQAGEPLSPERPS